MGLIDILNGMQNGPHGQRQPTTNASNAKAGAMSPIMMALLGLLAYKAFKGKGGQPLAPGSADGPGRLPPGGTVNADHSAGGIGDILNGLLGGKPGNAPATNSPAGNNPAGSLNDSLPGALGGLFGGTTAGTVLSSGLGNLIKEFQNSGQGRAAQSWIGTGPNQKIATNDLASALGSDTLDTLSQQTGVGRENLLVGLSKHLPDLIDQLTPNGRLPTEEEVSRLM